MKWGAGEEERKENDVKLTWGLVPDPACVTSKSGLIGLRLRHVNPLSAAVTFYKASRTAG